MALVALDDLDKAILNILQKDARKPYAEIAKELNTAEATIRFRVKRLTERRVITRFVALLNPVKVGFMVSGAILIKIDPQLIDGVSKRLSDYPEVPYIYRTTGEYDVVVAVYAHDMNHFNDLVKSIKMAEGVKDVRVSVITEFIKSDPTFKL